MYTLFVRDLIYDTICVLSACIVTLSILRNYNKKERNVRFKSK